MSFYQLPHPWDPHYVIPDYVMGEPPERGTFTTQWLPRGTIPELIPDYFAKKQPVAADAGHSLSGTSLSCPTLGCHTLKGSTLGGSSLGASAPPQQYVLTPTGAVAPVATGMSTGKKLAIGAGIAVAGYLAYKKLRKRR